MGVTRLEGRERRRGPEQALRPRVSGDCGRGPPMRGKKEGGGRKGE